MTRSRAGQGVFRLLVMGWALSLAASATPQPPPPPPPPPVGVPATARTVPSPFQFDPGDQPRPATASPRDQFRRPGACRRRWRAANCGRGAGVHRRPVPHHGGNVRRDAPTQPGATSTSGRPGAASATGCAETTTSCLRPVDVGERRRFSARRLPAGFSVVPKALSSGSKLKIGLLETEGSRTWLRSRSAGASFPVPGGGGAAGAG
jgi:hypothetical protein